MKFYYPYATVFGDVKLVVRKLSVDGTPLPNQIDDGGRLVELRGIGRAEWATANLKVTFTIPAAELTKFEDPDAYGALSCGKSGFRQPLKLTKAPTPGEWIGDLDIDRKDWFGKANLTAGLSETDPAGRRRTVASADPACLVQFDEIARKKRIGQPPPITWVDFRHPSEDEEAFLAEFAEYPFYVLQNPDTPRIFLNRGFENLETVLGNRPNRKGSELAFHDVVRSDLAVKVMSSLFLTSLGMLEEEDGVVLEPESDWYKGVLNLFLARMFSEVSSQQALEMVFEMRNEPQSAGNLAERALIAAEQLGLHPRLLASAIRNAELGIEPDEEVDRD